MTLNQDTPTATPTTPPESGAQGEPAAKAGEGDAGQDNGGDAEGQKHKRDPFQRAINRQTRKYYEEKARADLLERELERERAKNSQGSQKPAAAANPDAEPSADDFDDPKEYTKALAKWTTRQELKSQDKNAERNNAAARSEELESAFAEREDAHREDSPDYDDAVDNLRSARVRFSPSAIEFTMESEKGPAVLEFLGNNLKEAKRIAALSPSRQVAEMTRIEDKLSNAKPKKSGAPDPANPVRGKASVETDPDKLSDAEWFRRYKAGKKNK